MSPLDDPNVGGVRYRAVFRPNCSFFPALGFILAILGIIGALLFWRLRA